ncbi:PrGVORF97 [Pieris rapae granulovirus Wuhan]|uniref:PrGVORF97 n=1 Tax=Pieris rapae granulovirus Wuhan TaxID=2848030 RepID=D2J4R4_9BBAC|nr:PrGVORF97 [Betabaculovirus arrapae]ACZ63583.1 PrGVORF97 [Betabaculovirus arrapae]ADO85526.1 unknown [Pieris rapae granulovirus]
MKLHNMERISSRRIKNNQIVNIVREMLHAHNYLSKTKIKQKVIDEFYNINNKIQSETVTLINKTFEIMLNNNTVDKLLDQSFYKNCRLTNIVLLVVAKKHVVLTKQENVHLKVFLMGDSQLCVECYKKLGGTNTLPDINSECAVLPDNAYFFSCNYICDYCFTNKLYSKMCI